MLKLESERDRLIADAIQMEIGYENTQSLLEKKNMPKLYARDRRDTIFIWALYHCQKLEMVNKICKKYDCIPLKFTKKIQNRRKNMETVILIIYAVASYWATNKVLYEGKVVFYSSAYVHYMKKFLIGMMFGWILIPIAILKCIFFKQIRDWE